MDMVMYGDRGREVIDLIGPPERGDNLTLADGRRYRVHRVAHMRRGSPVIIVKRVHEPDSARDTGLDSQP